MRRLAFLLMLGCGMFATRLAVAHHSFAAVFDGDKPVTMTGQVTDVEWTNPHFHFSIDVKDPAGAVTRWRFEGYPPNMLVRQGWRRDETLMPGATVTVEGWASRDDATLGAVRWVTFADGKKLAGGPPAGTGGR
ncbi:MAG TPA: DUF6152 family protein [Gammaproteobacteria bacterium]